jgi:hypothetical protein
MGAINMNESAILNERPLAYIQTSWTRCQHLQSNQPSRSRGSWLILVVNTTYTRNCLVVYYAERRFEPRAVVLGRCPRRLHSAALCSRPSGDIRLSDGCRRGTHGSSQRRAKTYSSSRHSCSQTGPTRTCKRFPSRKSRRIPRFRDRREDRTSTGVNRRD